MASLPRLMRCGLCCTNDFFAEWSKPPASPGTMRSSKSQFFAPSRDPQAPRTMLVREQLEFIAAHNAYHLGRIVLLRQLFGAW